MKGKEVTIHKLPNGALSKFSEAEWIDIHGALMDAAAAEIPPSGPRVDRILDLARKIHETVLS